MHRSSRRTALAAVLLGGFVVLPLPGDAASADCIAGVPRFEDGREPPLVTRGETFTIVGDGYVQGCDDGGDSLGCGTPMHERPAEDVVLELHQRGETWRLATANAENDGDAVGHVSWTVTVPADAIPGRATLRADGGSALEVRIDR